MYETPELNVVELDAEDVITTSGGGSGVGDTDTGKPLP